MADWYPEPRGRAMRRASLQACAGRRSAVAMLKLDSGCVDCGYDTDPEALEFDHVRGTKLADVRRLSTSASIERVLAEIEKCEVVCANCHRIRTANRRRTGGAILGYVARQ